MKIVITGGTGFVGTYLQKLLLAQNFQIVIVSRTPKKSTIKGVTYAWWNPKQQKIDAQAICNADGIVHLAGASIAEKRWTSKQQQLILESRTQTATLLFKTLKENSHTVKMFISASGADCYGLRTTATIYKEKDAYGTDFLAKVCQQWEAAAHQFQELGLRTVCLRTGVVFANQNSALQKIAKPIALGLGAPLGSGKQILSFIHVHDLCKMYLTAIQTTQMNGNYNAVADNQTNTKVTQAIAKQLKKPLWLPNVPAFVLKVVFGKMATVLLKGSSVSNAKIKALGFKFKYPNLETILEDTL